jgi:hypothetical protein
MAIPVLPIMGLVVLIAIFCQAAFPTEDNKSIKKEKQKNEHQIEKDGEERE